MNITKDIDKNFWKYIGVVLLIIITIFFVKMTTCVCHLTEVLDNSLTGRENMANSTSTDEAAKEASTEEAAKAKASDAKAKATATASDAKAKATAAEAKAKATEEDVKAKEAATATAAKTAATDKLNDAKSMFGSLSEKASTMSGTSSLTNNLLSSDDSTGGDDIDEPDQSDKDKLEKARDAIDARTAEHKKAKDAVIAKKQDEINNLKTSLGNSMNTPPTSFSLTTPATPVPVLQESFTCDINSPTKIVAQYANIESLTKDCDKRIDVCSILKVKDKITGGNLYLDSYKQSSYASATNWHS